MPDAEQTLDGEHPRPWTTHGGEIFDANGELVARTWTTEGVWGKPSEIRVAHAIVEVVNGR